MGGGVLGERAGGIMRGRSEIPGGTTGWTSTWAWGCIVVATSRIVRSLTLTSLVWMWMFSPVCSLLWLDSQLSSTGMEPMSLVPLQPSPNPDPDTRLTLIFCFRGWAGVPTTYGDTTNLYFPKSREERAQGPEERRRRGGVSSWRFRAAQFPTSERRHRFHLGGVEGRISAALVET